MSMKKLLAFLLTGVLIGAALFLSRRQNIPEEDPQSAVWRMMDRSREGSVDGYLDCFTGPMRQQLEATAQGMTRPKFSEYLKEGAGKLKGIAISQVQRLTDAQASLMVEYVYQERNERQRLVLTLAKGTWRIESADGSQRIQPLIPYGKSENEIP